MEHFKKPLKVKLQSFVHVRSSAILSLPGGITIPKNKGKYASTIAGEDNLISRAYKLCDTPVLMVGGAVEDLTMEDTEAQIRTESQQVISFETVTTREDEYTDFAFDGCTDAWCREVKETDKSATRMNSKVVDKSFLSCGSAEETSRR